MHAGLLPLLSGQDLFKQDLGPGGDITAANFYAACATSLTAAAPHARSIGFGFVVEGPATHHLLRLELLAARAGLPLEDGAFNDIIHNKADSMLTEGAAKLFAHLWRHDRGSRKQMVRVCNTGNQHVHLLIVANCQLLPTAG